MAQKESNFKNMVLTLLAVTFVSSTAVGYVYEITKGPKAATLRRKQLAAIKNVLPNFTNDPLDEQYTVMTPDGDLIAYPAKRKGEPVGTAIETFSKQGYGGTIRLMVGLLPDGTIHNIAVLEHTETPGLGDKISKKKSDFAQQFSGKNPAHFALKVKQDSGDVDGITAATISSRAFCEAVQRAVDSLNRTKENGQR